MLTSVNLGWSYVNSLHQCRYMPWNYEKATSVNIDR
jgi:hypothetical protein